MFIRRLSAGKIKPLAYITGVYLGDGNVSRDIKDHSHSFRLNTIDYDFAEATADALLQLVGVKPKIYTYLVKKSSKPNNSLTQGCKLLCDFLEGETDKKKKIPDWVFKLPKEAKLEFIAGIMDSEGFVSVKKDRWLTVGMRVTSDWVYDFARLLKMVGCRVVSIRKEKGYKSWYKDVYDLRINTKSFLESGCYFKIKRKQERFKILRDYTPCPDKSGMI